MPFSVTSQYANISAAPKSPLDAQKSRTENGTALKAAEHPVASHFLEHGGHGVGGGGGGGGGGLGRG